MPPVPPFLLYMCRNETGTCPTSGQVRQVWLRTLAAGIVEMPGELLCGRCGWAVDQVTDYGGNPLMALRKCLACTTRFAVGAETCPHCGSTNHVEEGEQMAKNTLHGGPSNKEAPPGEPGHMPEQQQDGPGEDSTPPTEDGKRPDSDGSIDLDVHSSTLGQSSRTTQTDPAGGTTAKKTAPSAAAKKTTAGGRGGRSSRASS
jgi:hypothetical protein